MPVTVRSMRPEEARRFLEIHHAAVRDIAARDYPASVIEVWAPLPITDVTIERFLTNRDQEIRLMAEADGELVGIAPFYAVLGYRVEERGELVLAPGVPMAAVKMRKRLE